MVRQSPSRICLFVVVRIQRAVFVQIRIDCLLQSYLKDKIKVQNMNYSFDITENTQNTQNLQSAELSETSLQNRTMQKHLKQTKKSKAKISSFSWNKAEERKYISFLKTNGKLFSLTPKQRKEIKINVMMSYAIKSRTSSQCHSHHQKLLIKYGSIQGIIENHGLLFSKQQKGEVEAKQIKNNESIVEANQINQQVPLYNFFDFEQQKAEEPIWWEYLDFHEYDYQPQCNQLQFFFQ